MCVSLGILSQTNASSITIEEQSDIAPNGNTCIVDKIDDRVVYFYIGHDGVIGLSFDSCRAAYKEWQSIPSPVFYKA